MKYRADTTTFIRANSMKAKKIKYFKKMRPDKKICYAASWGYPLDLELKNGKTFHLVCEFCRGTGWIITDKDTGMLAQNKAILNKKQLLGYISTLAPVYSRITDSEYYKVQKDELKQFLERITKNGK